MSNMSYAELTVDDPNLIKRWLQQRRLADALSAYEEMTFGQNLRILDFGAGDGELARRLVESGAKDVEVYEPSPALLEEAKKNLRDYPQVACRDAIGAAVENSYDLIFCLEVFEHLPPAETDAALALISRLLADSGAAVIGVPHEIHAAALAKGLFRMARRFGDFDARPRNVLAAAFGVPPASRPVAEIASGLRYHFHHLGFDHRRLKAKLTHYFHLDRQWFSPVPLFRGVLNSEVYFLVRKAPTAGAVATPQDDR